MTPLELIGQSIDRLALDYDLALALAGGDESMVTLHLPAEWSVLVRRVCALINVEVERRAAAAAAVAPAISLEVCSVCAGRLWFVACDPVTLLRGVQCASCGTVCHV